MPIFMCTTFEMMNSIRMIATAGEPRICAVAAWLRPSSVIRMITAAMVSGILATAVRRWRQKCSVPDLAAPIAADAGQRGANMRGSAHHETPIVSRTNSHSSTVMAIEPIKLAAASHSRSVGPKPRPVSQIRWRTPPSMWWISAQV